jgi:hypothetical protein
LLRPSERLVQLQCAQEQQLVLPGSLHSLGSRRRLLRRRRGRPWLQGAGLTMSRTGLMSSSDRCMAIWPAGQVGIFNSYVTMLFSNAGSH